MTPRSRTGTITIEGDRATIAFERRLNHPIAVVWAALTEPEQRAAWFGATRIDPREGGTIETVADGPPAPAEVRRSTGRILAWDPPRVMEHEFNHLIVGDTVVRYELTPDGDATILRLTQSRLTETDSRGFSPGTHAYLDRLEAHLDGAPLPGWMERYGEVQGFYS
jgi:uncharacterized protein YndB with AHSA1/START domain